MKTVNVAISDIIFDKELYPRQDTDWMKVFHYRMSMDVGSKFPPIDLGEFEGKLYAVNGWHRTKAHESRGEKTVEAVVKKYSSKKQMFIDSVLLNSTNALPFSVMDKAHIFAKLQEYEVSNEQISKLLGTPIEKFKVYLSKLVTVQGREVPIASIIERAIKSQAITEEEAVNIVTADQQKNYVSRTVTHAFVQLIDAVKQGAVDWSDPDINILAIQLVTLLNAEIKKVE